MLNIGFIGRTVNRSNTWYKLNIYGIIQEIASTWIRFIQPMKIDGTELEGTEWNISKHLDEASSSRIPEDSIKITEKGESFRKNRGMTSSNIFGVAYKINNKGKAEEK